MPQQIKYVNSTCESENSAESKKRSFGKPSVAMAMKFDEDGLRNFKDFLLTYNKLSEACFNTCILNFNSR